MNSEIMSIFPTPIYRSTLGRELTKKELSLVKKAKKESHRNEGNLTSNDNYILKNKIFKNLKKELELRITDYFKKIVQPNKYLSFYITQSWLNYTEKSEYHHKHEHPNSFISGVFYINSNDQFDKIKFFRKVNEIIIRIEPETWNEWNAESWWLPVKTGDILLFPSSTTHMVENKQGDNTRISLAFNVFIKGKIGRKEKLIELYL
jgi:uncharacterized protein (TIGR02466 family)